MAVMPNLIIVLIRLNALCGKAAIDSSLLVWGRKHETPLGSNPLLLIPKEHFEDFECHNGCLNKCDNEKKRFHTYLDPWK